ncbi:MAG: HlyD family type I secretion periplasmic adaptor subunit [Gammaproteobacteria bacterium]|nr:HlyD family type I secretion periplasmic adaptor subunit [Gammaproteobacteria bacterium]
MSRQLETAFLPAALEIERTPASPVGRAIIWTIAAVFVAAVVWAALSKVDIVVVAPGRVIPSGHSKAVQALEIGTVKRIHVAEGQHVETGDVLIELDPDSAAADVANLLAQRDAGALESARLQRLAEWLAQDTVPATADPAGNEDTLLLRRWREHRDKVSVLHTERDRRSAEQRTATQQVEKLRAIMPIVSRRASDHKNLSEQKLLSEQEYLHTEQARLERLHELRMYQSRVDELAAAIEEIDARIALTRSEFARQVSEGLDEVERRRATIEQELIKAQTRLKAQTITAPVAGVVQQLAVNSVGAVVTPAQMLLVVVPRNEMLEVEAMIENKDIGFVEPGQEVAIKVDAFPFTRYGSIGGWVLGIANDAVPDETRGLVYTMRVALERSQIAVNGHPVELGPGMTVSVETKTGTRRLIEFFLSPLLRYKDESVRER